MVSNVNISQKVCFFFTFLVLFSGCSSESPDISYQGVSAENALILLNRAKTTKEVDHIIARVDRDPRYGFDWKEFWEGVRPQVSKMNREQQESLFALGTKVCSPTAFNAFALTVSAIQNFIKMFYQEELAESFSIMKTSRCIFLFIKKDGPSFLLMKSLCSVNFYKKHIPSKTIFFGNSWTKSVLNSGPP